MPSTAPHKRERSDATPAVAYGADAAALFANAAAGSAPPTQGSPNAAGMAVPQRDRAQPRMEATTLRADLLTDHLVPVAFGHTDPAAFARTEAAPGAMDPENVGPRHSSAPTPLENPAVAPRSRPSLLERALAKSQEVLGGGQAAWDTSNTGGRPLLQLEADDHHQQRRSSARAQNGFNRIFLAAGVVTAGAAVALFAFREPTAQPVLTTPAELQPGADIPGQSLVPPTTGSLGSPEAAAIETPEGNSQPSLPRTEADPVEEGENLVPNRPGRGLRQRLDGAIPNQRLRMRRRRIEAKRLREESAPAPAPDDAMDTSQSIESARAALRALPDSADSGVAEPAASGDAVADPIPAEKGTVFLHPNPEARDVPVGDGIQAAKEGGEIEVQREQPRSMQFESLTGLGKEENKTPATPDRDPSAPRAPVNPPEPDPTTDTPQIPLIE